MKNINPSRQSISRKVLWWVFPLMVLAIGILVALITHTQSLR